jgi:hypothetical protein
MSKRVLGCRSELHLLDQFRIDQRGDVRVADQAGQQTRIESGPDDCCGIQCAFGARLEPVDARTDSGLQGRGHLHVGDIAAQFVHAGLAPQRTALREIANDLLDEKRVT